MRGQWACSKCLRAAGWDSCGIGTVAVQPGNSGRDGPALSLHPNLACPTLLCLQIPAALAMEQGMLGPASPIPTQCLLLKNMFNPAE